MNDPPPTPTHSWLPGPKLDLMNDYCVLLFSSPLHNQQADGLTHYPLAPGGTSRRWGWWLTHPSHTGINHNLSTCFCWPVFKHSALPTCEWSEVAAEVIWVVIRVRLDTGNTAETLHVWFGCLDVDIWYDLRWPSSNPSTLKMNLQADPSFLHLARNDGAYELLKQNQVILRPVMHQQLHPKR